MFDYFGYGSNMSVTSLRAKGVEPIGWEPAMAHGWRLTFDVADFFLIEGGMGNMQPSDDHTTHGIVYRLRDEDLERLDKLEAFGVCYTRARASLRTYSGDATHATIYVGLDAVLDATCLPSKRYVNILLRGAEEMKLDPTYIDELRTTPTRRHPDYSLFRPPDAAVAHEVITLDELAQRKMHTSIGGALFDMSAARPRHTFLQEFFSGKDMTLFFLKRMDTSDGQETFGDVLLGSLRPEQRRFVNDYVHEFAREYRFVGHVDYGHPSCLRLGTPLTGVPSPGPVEVASRRVFDTADLTNRELGHENFGFLSETHGFMPRVPPLRSLPRSHAAWDEAAASLPDGYCSLRLRDRLDQLPLLSAAEEDLPDACLLRASAVLAMLAHAYYYVESEPPQSVPSAILTPWSRLRRRLGRGAAVLSYIDLIVYNWRLLDDMQSDPMRVENMRLLIPTVDNDEERIFYLTQVEILAQCSPIVGAMVRAQEAAAHDDKSGLENELLTIVSRLNHVVRSSLLKINPNPMGTTYVDPVVWAKTVAPFAVPMQPGVQGPSGTSSPIFNALDIFLGRRRFDSFLGREIRRLRNEYPPHWRVFLAALHRVSITEYVERVGDPQLSGLLHETNAAYAGVGGFLGRHRLKVYGYLEQAFKVGRDVTIGGFSGVFKDRTWDRVDNELRQSRLERLQRFPMHCHRGRLKATPGGVDDCRPVSEVAIDVSETGVRCEPGDRCGILPENSSALVNKTLSALGASGAEAVALTEEWRNAMRLRSGYGDARELTLEELLRFGRIRPMQPRVAEALHAITQDTTLKHQLESGGIRDWELWDVLERLTGDGFQPEQLWRNSVESDANICRIVPPETFRMYSISSVSSPSAQDPASEIMLTISRVRYRSEKADGSGEVLRLGTASTFLTTAERVNQPLSFIIEHPPRFSLPKDPTTPVVMFAGGTGISPFRAFVEDRWRAANVGSTWLLLVLRRQEEFLYSEELGRALRDGTIELNVAFTRDDIAVAFDKVMGELKLVPAPAQSLKELIHSPDNAARLVEMMNGRDRGGLGAVVYVCGSGRFAKAVHDELLALLDKDASDEDRDAGNRLSQLAGEGRYLQEIFTDQSAWQARAGFRLSDIACHNDAEHGYWLIIEGLVYDVTKFVHMHPGGVHTLRAYAGIDATNAYERSHVGRTEIDAMRAMYEIGAVRQPRFGHVVIAGSNGEPALGLGAIYRCWVAVLHVLVEMQNTLRSDQSLQERPTTRDEPLAPRSPYRLQKAVEAHNRFMASYVTDLEEPAIELWHLTQRMTAESARPDWMEARLRDVQDRTEARTVERFGEKLEEAIGELASGDDVPSEKRERLMAACEFVEDEDAGLLAAFKEAFCQGVGVFERHQERTREDGTAELLSTCERFPGIFAAYYANIAAYIETDTRWSDVPASDSIQPNPTQLRAGLKIRMSNKYWVFEQDDERQLAVMRRTPTAFSSPRDVEAMNDEVLAAIEVNHANYGLVVDYRGAPSLNDPVFEDSMKRFRRQLGSRFMRLAVLVEGASGILQVNRLTRLDKGQTYATRIESQAINFAMGR